MTDRLRDAVERAEGGEVLTEGEHTRLLSAFRIEGHDGDAQEMYLRLCAHDRALRAERDRLVARVETLIELLNSVSEDYSGAFTFCRCCGHTYAEIKAGAVCRIRAALAQPKGGDHGES